jgi:fibronectin-binding autotransporter adhesin
MKAPYKPLFSVLRQLPAMIVVSLAAFGTSLHAQSDGTWTLNGSGNWNDSANWALGNIASGATQTADFSTLNITADQTVTMDAAFTIGKLLAGDFTTASNNWIIAGPSLLTLDNGGSAPVVTINNQFTTISAPIAGTNGLSKAGAGVLFLSGNNSGLSGTLTIQDVAATNNNGVVLTNNNAIGGMTSVNIQGSGSSGGFFQLEGGVTLPNTVAITLNSQGGNSAPPGGIRATGTGTINTIQGPINVTFSGARISNNSAQRLDISGVISGTNTNILYRFAANEGIRLTGANTYTGETINSGGILWCDPVSTLPVNSLLSIATSDPGTFQSSGSFTRSLGSSPGNVRFSQLNINSSTRTMGFSARGGALTVNLGGAAAEVPFNNFTTNANGLGTAINTNTLWLNNATADSKLTITNPLNLNGADRSFQVDANTAELLGGITGINNITKAGAGTLLHTPALDVAATRTITVNGGTFNIAGAITGNGTLTKAGNSPLVASGGMSVAAARGVTVSAGTLDVSGGLNGGNFLVTKNAGAGTLLLSGPSTWTGGLTTPSAGTTNFGTIRITHPEGLGPAATAKTVSVRGNNQSFALVELAGGITIDANKTLSTSGKSFYSGANLSGSPVSLRSASGSNTWSGNYAIAETGGAYAVEALSGATLTLGASPATTNTIRNSGTGDSRALNTFGAGDFVFNSKIAVNGTSKINLVANGGGTITIPRGDNDFDQIPALNSGTVEIVKMSNNGLGSSLGTATSFNLGGTLRYTGTGDSANRTLGLLAKGGTIDSSGTGPLSLTSTTLSHQNGQVAASTAAFAIGATTLTLTESGGLAVGSTVTGTAIAPGTTVTATNPSARTVTLSQGTSAASASSVGLTFAGQADINRTLTLTGTNTGDNLFAAELTNPAGTGALGVTKTGPGKWILSGTAKTNTGALNVQSGVLELQSTGFPASSATVAAGSTLVLNKLTSPMAVTGSLTLEGNIIAYLPGAPAFGSYNVIQYGSVSGAGTLTSPFRGSTTLGATTGSITVAAGIPLTWTGAASANWDVISSINWQDGAAAPETFHIYDSVTFDSTGAAQPNVNLVGELLSSGVTVNEATTDYAFSGTGFLSGSGGLVKSGAAALTVNTANTFTGGVTINGGTLRVGNNAALGVVGQAITINAGGTLDTRGAYTASRDYAATISGTGVGGAGAIINSVVDNNFGVGSLTLADNASIGGSFRWDVRPITAGAAVVNLAGFKLTKTGTNYIPLVDGSLTADGTIDIDQGILGFTRMVVSGIGSVTVRNGAILRFEGNSTGSWTDKPVTLNNGTINMFGSNYTLDAEITLTNTGTLDIGATRVMTLPRKVTGSGGLTMATGTGTLVLNGANDYSGPTQIDAGTLLIGNRVASGTPGTGDITNNGTLRFSRSDSATIANDISGTGGVIIGANATVAAGEYDAITTLSGNNTFTGNITVFSGGVRILDETGVGTGPKTIVVGTTNGTNGRPQFYLDGSAGDITLPANVALSTSNAQLTHPAIGNIAGNNTIEGPITLTSGGGSTSVKVLGGSLALNGPITANTASRSLVLAGNLGSNGTVNGIISNSGADPVGLTKQETNTWTLTADNTYTGGTAINAGTLLINGNQSASTGVVTVNNTATLGGIGTIGGAVTVNTGGTIAPGSSGIESLATGALTINTGATIAIDINTNTATADQLIVTGNVDLTGTADLTINDLGTNAVLAPGTKLVLADYSGLWADTDVVQINGNPVANETTVVIGANTFTVDYSDDTLGGTAMTLTVPGGGDSYTSWADTFSLTGADRAPSADPDNDGLENGIEFVIGANPNTNTPLQDRPAGNVIGTDLVFTFKRSDASEDFDVFVQHGTTLATWPGQIAIPTVDTTGLPVDVTDNGPAALDDVIVTIPMGTDPSKFARLKVEIPYTP